MTLQMRILVIAFWVMLVSEPLSAQTGSITGTIIARGTRAPVSGAQVVLVGTSRGVLTDSAGRFQLDDVRAGSSTVQVVMLGFAPEFRTVLVPLDGRAAVDIALALTAISLDQVVVTVTGEQRRRALSNSVSRIDATQVAESVPIANLSELLNARAVGVQVMHSAGTPGAGSRIRIRGANSVSLSNEPILYVDGARIYDAFQGMPGVITGGQWVSRINDINPQEIETIEVVKGPSAATLYGTDAANGVILVTTKRGHSGPARWNAFAETGMSTDPSQYPLNYRGKVSDDPLSANCFVYQLSAGQCTQGALLGYQPLTDPVVGAIGTGSLQSFGLNVSGGSDAVNYFLSGDWLAEVGTLELPDTFRTAIERSGAEVFDWQNEPSAVRKMNARGNLSAHLVKSLDVDLSTGYLASKTRLPQNDGSDLGILISGLLGQYSPIIGLNHGYSRLPPDKAFVHETLQEISRFTTSLQSTWRPARWSFLTGRALVGVDVTSRHDSNYTPRGAVTELAARAPGVRTSNRYLVQSWTGESVATASFNVRPALTSRTSLGVQYYRNMLRGTLSTATSLIPGLKSVAGAAILAGSERTTETVTAGVFGEQQFGWRERLFVTAGLRADDHSAFGDRFNISLYPKAGLSYVLISAAGNERNTINTLRFRGAWGTSGVAPGVNDGVRFYHPSVVNVGGIDQSGVTFGQIGNADLKPERSTEVEAGFEAGLFNDRLGIDLTYYRKTTDDALIARPLAPSLGVNGGRFENIGSVRNQGFEAAVKATVLDFQNARFDVSLSGSYNDNKLLKLGEGIEPFGGLYQRREGYPLAGYWDIPITFEDRNGDSLITLDEITRGTSAVFLGPLLAKTQLSVTPTLTAFDLIRTSALFDYRGGFRQYNQTELFRCVSNICRGLNDTNASLFEQARAVETALRPGARTNAPYIEDGTYLRLRELSLAVAAPKRLAQRLGARRVELVLSGRNLKIWTRYSGLDPEVNAEGGENFLQVEYMTQPPVQTWIMRVNVGF